MSRMCSWVSSSCWVSAVSVVNWKVWGWLGCYVSLCPQSCVCRLHKEQDLCAMVEDRRCTGYKDPGECDPTDQKKTSTEAQLHVREIMFQWYLAFAVDIPDGPVVRMDVLGTWHVLSWSGGHGFQPLWTKNINWQCISLSEIRGIWNHLRPPRFTVSTRYALRSLAQIVTAGCLPTWQTFLTFLRKIKQLYT